MIQDAIKKLVAGVTLAEEEASAVAEEIMTGEASAVQMAAYLVALRMNVESVAEITGMARVMRSKAVHVPIDGDVVEVVGTGGDGMSTFNISTAASLVAAAAGARVAKHGNRAASGSFGAADILEAYGVKMELGPEAVRRCVNETGFGFMFAPAFHPAMRFAGPVRRELGVRNVFNILGPLTNPAGARHQVVGVSQPSVVMNRYQPELGEMLAHVLVGLGGKHCWVVRGDDGLDEITTTDTTQVWEVKEGRVRHFELWPEDAGLRRAALEGIQAGNPEAHRALFHQALGGEDGPPRDVVLMNAAAALYVAGKAGTLKEGVDLGRRAIDTGAALRLLQALASLTQELA